MHRLDNCNRSFLPEYATSSAQDAIRKLIQGCNRCNGRHSLLHSRVIHKPGPDAPAQNIYENASYGQKQRAHGYAENACKTQEDVRCSSKHHADSEHEYAATWRVGARIRCNGLYCDRLDQK